jgi:hypothetical protein
MSLAQRFPAPHFWCGAQPALKTYPKKYREKKMKQLLKMTAAPAAAMFTMGFVAMATPAAAASPVDYCRHDVTSGMRGCGYSSLEQCQAMSSGRGGSCYENPFPENGSKGAYAYQPKHAHSKREIHRAKNSVENQ